MNYSKIDGNRNGIVRPVSGPIIRLFVRLSFCLPVSLSVCPFCWLCTCILYLTFAFFKQRTHPSLLAPRPSSPIAHGARRQFIHSFIHSLSFAQCVFIHAFVCFLTHVSEKLCANKLELKQKRRGRSEIKVKIKI